MFLLYTIAEKIGVGFYADIICFVRTSLRIDRTYIMHEHNVTTMISTGQALWVKCTLDDFYQIILCASVPIQETGAHH